MAFLVPLDGAGLQQKLNDLLLKNSKSNQPPKYSLPPPFYLFGSSSILLSIEYKLIMIRLKQIVKYYTSNLSQYYFKDKKRDAVIFTSQNTKWDHGDLHIQSTAMARGLKQMQFIEGDKMLLKLSPSQQMEMLVLKIAAANLSITISRSEADSQEKLWEELKKSKARGLIFDAHSSVGNYSMIQAIYQIMPNLRSGEINKQIRHSDFRYLRYLIQTDSYPYAGILKFKDILRYGLTTDYFFFFECKQKHKSQLEVLQNKDRPILITDPLDDFVFEGAILNCLLFGRIVYIVQPHNFKQIAQRFNDEVDYVGTQEMEVKANTCVYVPVGSKIFKTHKNRFQI